LIRRYLGADIGATTGVSILLVLAIVVMAFMSLALGRSVLSREADLVAGILVAAVALVLARICDGGFVRPRGWSVFGAAVALARTLACVAPAFIAVSGVIVSTGRFVIEEMVADQGGVPWRWAAARSPGAAILFLVLVASAVPESAYRGIVSIEGLEPTTLPRSSSRVALRIAEWAYLFAICGFACALFLGGWRVPTVTYMVQESSRRLQAVGALLFLAKFLVLLGAVLIARRAFARLFLEEVFGLFARWTIAASLVGACLAVGWAAGFDGAKTQVPSDLLGYSATVLVGAFALAGASIRLRAAPANASISTVNPWL
jgi:NADH:ubiquinone oxidoreductase subunit H